jgi:hypothetical protein
MARGESVIKLTDPAKIPAAPTPESARPTMNAAQLGADPHTAEPASNNTILERKTIFMEYRV